MRKFAYFFFENFDPGEEVNSPENPRNFLGKETDTILSAIAEGMDDEQALCDQYGVSLVQKLITGGVLRRSNARILFDCPVFLREDAAVLRTEIASHASALVDVLEDSLDEIRACCARIENGFPIALNLYHILCGMVFDGSFFDHLSNRGALATSRQNPSGLDYLTVIYEKCEELQALSHGLLCSYNRFVNEKCALQSFGDAHGDRVDFYRFFRLMEQGTVPGKFKEVETLIHKTSKDALLDEVITLIQTDVCDPDVVALLERFGYMQNGSLCVPVYLPEHQTPIRKIGEIVEKCLGEAMSKTLMDLTSSIEITSVRHSVNPLEIANELYHIVFGSINEELVTRGIVTKPEYIPGEGRFLKCIELY